MQSYFISILISSYEMSVENILVTDDSHHSIKQFIFNESKHEAYDSLTRENTLNLLLEYSI